MLITNEGSTTTATLQGAITVKAAGARVEALDNTATINPDWDNIEVEGATFVRTINGVSPDSNGAFFLSGSECDSWGYIVGGTAVDAGYKDGDGLPVADPVVDLSVDWGTEGICLQLLEPWDLNNSSPLQSCSRRNCCRRYPCQRRIR